MRAHSVVAALYLIINVTGESIGARKDDEQVELEGQTKNFGGVIESSNDHEHKFPVLPQKAISHHYMCLITSVLLIPIMRALLRTVVCGFDKLQENSG